VPFRPSFCSACGGRVVETRAPGQRPGTDGRFDCAACGRRHYLNSKPCVGGLVVRDGRVLLVKRAFEPFKDWWDVPGGFLEAGEHPHDGVARELLEESGLEVRPGALVGIYMDRYGDDGDPTLNLYYECAVVGGAELAGDDAAELGWFQPDALPEQVAFESGRRVLADWSGRPRSSPTSS
jgi:ADP-ribose pyrophosphatase YjhB (NUDIX family)